MPEPTLVVVDDIVVSKLVSDKDKDDVDNEGQMYPTCTALFWCSGIFRFVPSGAAPSLYNW